MTKEDDEVAEDVLDYDPYSVLEDFGLQKASPLTVKEIRQLDSKQKKKWFDATAKELNSLNEKKTFTRMTAKDVYDTYWRNGIKTKNLPSRMVYVKSLIQIFPMDGKKRPEHADAETSRKDHGRKNWELGQMYQMHTT